MDCVIEASELYELAKKMLNDGMDYVSVSILDPDDSVPNDPLPAAVHFEAFKKASPALRVDYDDLDAVEL